MTKLGLYARTLRHLKFRQITNRIFRRIFPVRLVDKAAPKVRAIGGHTFLFIKRQKSILSENEFQFLNKREILSFPDGWNNKNIPKLWLYNLHYFEGLLNQETPKTIKKHLIELWIEQNPPGIGNGWEPYPNSLRIVNWIKWVYLGNQLTPQAEKSLATQVRYLTKTLEYHLLGNHLFANAKALIWAGIFFEGNEADDWFETGFNILKEQIPEQFLTDGAHFELSTSYHALLTEDLLDIIQLLKAWNRSIPTHWIEVAKKAVCWLTTMTRPDGHAPLFNDSAYGIMPSLKNILYLCQAAGLKQPSILNRGMTDLVQSGYFRFDADCYSFFGDGGQIGPDYIPGHSHCDMLSFELYAHGKPVIVDTGTSTYELCERRNVERGTASHNTVQFGHEEQSEIWGAFRVGSRAVISKRNIRSYSASLTMKGHRYNHSRDISFSEKEIVINDKVLGSYEDKVCVARFHFHPNVTLDINENVIVFDSMIMLISGATSIIINDYHYAPEFNRLFLAQVLEVTFNRTLETKISL